jgi:hypothetical protein
MTGILTAELQRANDTIQRLEDERMAMRAMIRNLIKAPEVWSDLAERMLAK